jgi:hypothetical protein
MSFPTDRRSLPSARRYPYSEANFLKRVSKSAAGREVAQVLEPQLLRGLGHRPILIAVRWPMVAQKGRPDRSFLAAQRILHSEARSHQLNR